MLNEIRPQNNNLHICTQLIVLLCHCKHESLWLLICSLHTDIDRDHRELQRNIVVMSYQVFCESAKICQTFLRPFVILKNFTKMGPSRQNPFLRRVVKIKIIDKKTSSNIFVHFKFLQIHTHISFLPEFVRRDIMYCLYSTTFDKVALPII